MSRLVPPVQHPLKHLLDLIIGVLPLFNYFYNDDAFTEMYFTDDALTEAYISQDI